MHATLYFQISIHLLIPLCPYFNSHLLIPLLQELALLNQVEELGNAIDIIQEGLKYIAGYIQLCKQV